MQKLLPSEIGHSLGAIARKQTYTIETACLFPSGH